MSDPFLIPSLVSGGLNALGNLAEGGINAATQAATNQTMVNLADTAIQRRQKDLAAAGINPLMAGKIGGADTPTLQAPHMTGISNAVQGLTPNAIQENSFKLQQQEMSIKQTEAETAKLEADRNAALTHAALEQKQTSWYDTRQSAEMNLIGAQTQETSAKTAQIRALTDPQVKNIAAEIALKNQQTATETQRTITESQIANNAKAKYGAEAQQAQTAAKQAADFYTNFFKKTQNLTLDKLSLEADLLDNENFHQALENVLENEYGRATRWTELYGSPTKSVAAAAAGLAGNKMPQGTIVQGYIPGHQR